MPRAPRLPQGGEPFRDRPAPVRVRAVDHVGITVTDLVAATGFFVSLGLETEGSAVLEGDFLDTVIGIAGARTEIVMLRAPGGGTGVELSSFERPEPVPSGAAPVNQVGLRSLVLEVDDLQAAVDRVGADGYGLVGGVGQFEGAWSMAYVRGPDGIIVALAQRLG